MALAKRRCTRLSLACYLLPPYVLLDTVIIRSTALK
jgi:hypothetical protein